jgi:hypothetical protein
MSIRNWNLRGERAGKIKFKKAMELVRKGFPGSKDYSYVCYLCSQIAWTRKVVFVLEKDRQRDLWQMSYSKKLDQHFVPLLPL